MNKINNKACREELEKNYQESLENAEFKKLIKTLKIDAETAKLNNSSLMDCVQELGNCAKCKGLFECQNKVMGHFIYPKKDNSILDFGYYPCKYHLEQEKLQKLHKTAKTELEEANFKSIDVHDKNRIKVIKWLTEFFDNYDYAKNLKGLYLHGSFGGGKTYLIYALLNELKNKKKANFMALYFPEILRTLKDDWNTYQENLDRYSNIDILLIDDIGAESVSEWGRDEVLGTILQNRMNNHLPTFFTSNLNIEELEAHLALTKNSTDKVKARRIIERIKQLTEQLEMITDNKRV